MLYAESVALASLMGVRDAEQHLSRCYMQNLWLSRLGQPSVMPNNIIADECAFFPLHPQKKVLYFNQLINISAQHIGAADAVANVGPDVMSIFKITGLAKKLDISEK